MCGSGGCTCAMLPLASEEQILSSHAAGEFTSMMWAKGRGGVEGGLGDGLVRKGG